MPYEEKNPQNFDCGQNPKAKKKGRDTTCKHVHLYLGYAGCWPKKKAGQNAKNGQNSWPAGQKNQTFIRHKNKKKGPTSSVGQPFFLLTFFL